MRVRSPIAKFLVAVAGVLGLVAKAVADGTVDATEIGEIITGALVAFGVWRVPNTPST